MNGIIMRLAGVGLCVGALLATAPPAHAACYGSTPATTAFPDSPFDGDSGLAPEISTVTATVDATCDLAVNPGVDALIGDDSVLIYIDRDGNPATGSALFGGADIVVGTLGEIGPDSPPLMGVWDGTQFTFTDPSPVGTSLLIGGFSATLDRLGVSSGVVTHYFVASEWQGIYDDYFDWAPDIGSGLTIGLPVSYSTVAPPPPPPPAPVVPAAPAPAPATPVLAAPVHKRAGCTVPRVKRRTPAAARRRIAGSGCRVRSGTTRRYSSRIRRGRVIGTIPSVGSVTGGRVRLVVSKGRRRHHAHASSAGRDSGVLAQLQRLANAPLR